MTTATAAIQATDTRIDHQGRTTVVLTVLFIATSSWSGLLVGPAQVSDLVLAILALVLLLGPRPARGRPRAATGLWILLALLSLANIIATIAPPDPTWVSMRFAGFGSSGPTATRSGIGSAGLGAWAVPLKLMLATVLVWVILQRLHILRPDSARRLVCTAWLAGATASAAVATAEAFAGLDLSSLLARPIGEQTRVSGLAFYPNALALACVLAMPLTARVMSRRSGILPGLAILITLWTALLVSDSRIGIAVGVAITATLPFLAGRGKAGGRVIAGGVLLCLTAPWIIQGLDWISSHTRLAAGAGSASDAGRALVNAQSIADFQHSPFYGLGFGIGGSGISVPLMLLSAGGLFAAVGVLAVALWVASTLRGRLGDPDVRIMLVSLFGLLSVMCAQNNLVDRGQYLPVLLAVIWALYPQQESSDRP